MFDESWVAPPKPNKKESKIQGSRNDAGQMMVNDDPMMSDANAPLQTWTNDCDIYG